MNRDTDRFKNDADKAASSVSDVIKRFNELNARRYEDAETQHRQNNIIINENKVRRPEKFVKSDNKKRPPLQSKRIYRPDEAPQAQPPRKMRKSSVLTPEGVVKSDRNKTENNIQVRARDEEVKRLPESRSSEKAIRTSRTQKRAVHKSSRAPERAARSTLGSRPERESKRKSVVNSALGEQTVGAKTVDRPVKQKTRRHRVPPIVSAAAIVLVFILVLAGSFGVLWAKTLGKIRRDNPDLAIHELADKHVAKKLNNPTPYDKDITNILLLGVDSRDMEDLNERTDSMIILTIDQVNKKIKLTSLQRDMLVYIPGRDEPDKLTHVNVYGGPRLLMSTIRDNLRLDIDRYVMVNMRKMEDLVDILGGIEINVDDEVLDITNDIIGRANRTFPNTPEVATLPRAGRQTLNGRQSVSYARNRSTGRGDYDRMMRQQEVIQAMYDKFRQADAGTQLTLISEALSNVSTNLSNQEILGIVQSALPILGQKIEKKIVPSDEFARPYLGDMWVLLCDFNGIIPDLQKFIFGKTFPFDPVREIPGAPNSSIDIPEPADTGINDSDYVIQEEQYYSSEEDNQQSAPDTDQHTVDPVSDNQPGTDVVVDDKSNETEPPAPVEGNPTPEEDGEN